MNSKAIKRQLLAAIAMVLVAAIALGSSTYAWFVASGSVKATGMKVQVQAESGILIREHKAVDNTDVFSTVAEIQMNSAKLYPTSTPDLKAWYHNNSNTATDAKGGIDVTDGSKYTAISTTDSNIFSQYALKKQFAIRSATQTPIDGKIAIESVSISEGGTTTQDLYKSVRVGITVSTGAKTSSPEVYIYAPLCDDASWKLTAAYKTTEAPNATAVNVTENKAVSRTGDVLNDTFELSNGQIPITEAGLIVDVYVWFEGEDPNCKTENITGRTPDDLTATVVFKQV